MEVFAHSLTFKSWGEIYLGLKMNWIQPQNVFDYCQNGKIKLCDENRHVQLSLALEDSLYDFLELMKKYIVEDGDFPIIKNEDECSEDMHYIPHKYWNLWKLEFLLRVLKNSSSIEDRQEKVYELFYIFNFPDDWQDFIMYSSKYPNALPHFLDDKMKRYIDIKIKEFTLTHRQS